MRSFVSIQDLRGVAALGVLAFHAAAYAAGYGAGSAAMQRFQIGEAGVDVFFVISGFVLTLATERPLSPLAFLRGRLLRVGVPYWVVTAGLAGAALVLPAAFRGTGWSGGDLALSLAFVPSIVRDGGLFPLLEPGWTLSLEALFYLLLAFCLALAPRARAFAMIAGLSALVAVGLAAGPATGPLWFFTQPVLLEFAAGVLLAHLRGLPLLASARSGLALLALALAGFGIGSLLAPGAFTPARTVLYGPPSLCLVAGCVALEQAGRFPRLGIAEWLGRISYSLYLVHVPVLALVARLAGARLADIGGDALLLAVLMLAALPAAAVFHRLVERPAQALAARRPVAMPQASSMRTMWPGATSR